MPDIIIKVEQTQQFHDDFDHVTQSMLEHLTAIKHSFDTNCDAWRDEARDQFEAMITEMIDNLQNFIDNECQDDLRKLQELINRAEEVMDAAKKIHKG